MTDEKLALMGHLMRRAGFGATRTELEGLTSKAYEDVVEELLHPERFPDVEEDVLKRYYAALNSWEPLFTWCGRWLYRMINTRRPLEEKMALFWHHVFATGYNKSEHTPTLVTQIDSFRQNGMKDMKTILMDLSRDPAMIDWLDNNENHRDAPNENYGRELLELFSMGVGNYTEYDIKNAARAFTGWTMRQVIPLYPHGHHVPEFVYDEEDHDDSEKEFLGRKGRFNGEDIIDIILEEPATARFICRHLYNFFVADEPQVPAWETVPPQDPEAIETLMNSFTESGYSIKAVLRTLFNSDFFKQARYKKVKSPTELVVGIVRLTGEHRFPEPGLVDLDTATMVMGQRLMDPPTVEGWHTGKEWIDGGTLNERVNFAVDRVGDVEKPGIRDIVDALGSGGSLSPEDVVEGCLEQLGAIDVGQDTRQALMHNAAAGGSLSFDTEEERQKSVERIQRTLQLIVASTEFQFA